MNLIGNKMGIKKYLVGCVMMMLSASSVYADGNCPLASSISSTQFCESFKAAGECNCINNGLPARRCKDMNFVYRLAVDTLGNLQRVCEYQHIISTTECIDGWNCYRYGGFTSDGQLCNGTGHACE